MARDFVLHLLAHKARNKNDENQIKLGIHGKRSTVTERVVVISTLIYVFGWGFIKRFLISNSHVVENIFVTIFFYI